MTDVKISQLQELDQVGDKDTLIVNDASDGGRTKKVRKENLFADTVKNVTDVGNDAVVSQDLIVNNDIEVGGDVRATGELSFGKLRDHVTQVTVNGIVDNADDFLTLDSTIPTSGAIRGYVVDTMAEMGVGALNDKIEGLRYDIYSKDSAFINDVIATATLPLVERLNIDSDNLESLEGEFDQFKIDVNRDIGNNNSTLSNLNSRMGVAEGGITTLTNTVASLDTDLSSRIDLTNINLGLLTNRVSTNEEAILSLDSALQIEIAARQQGDANLDSDLTAETNARIDALSALSGDLDSEKSDRFAAINDLISRLDSEKDDRLDAIESILAQLDSEKEDRFDAIEDLLAELDSERFDRINSIQGASSNLDSERADRIQADADLLGLIDSERGARILGDAAVQSNLDSEARALSLAISNLSSKVDSETSNRLDAIEDLLDLLDSERSDRIDDNENIQTGLDSEISARIDALSELTSSLDSERTSRLADEQSLRQDLTDLINQGDSDTLASAKAHDTLLIGDASIDGTSGNTVVERIDSARDYAIQQAANTVGIENSARIAADSDLRAQIDAEELRAKGEEQRIEDKINNVITNTDPAAIDSLTEIVNYLNEVDSDVRQLVSSNTTRVSDETSERLAGDSALGVRIDQEIAARRAADSDLQDAINTSVNTEASLRSAADSDINARIDQEVLNRLSVGEDLQGNIDSAREELIDRIEQEESLRAVGDSATLSAARLYTRQRDALMIGDATVDGTAGNTITSRIATAKQEANTYTDNEIIGLRSGEVTSLTARMDSAESRLDDAETAIDSATARLSNINKTLSDLIDSESQRAIGIEGNLQSQIDSGLGRTLNLESDLTSMIDSETQRAIRVEGNLQSQIDSATLRLTNINQTLDGLIDSEMNRALDAESELRGLIDSELSRAIDAERFLRDLIDSSLSLSINADSDIRLDIDANTAAIDSEITRAIRVDGELQDLIDSASLRLTNINQTLSDLIDSEMTRALAVEGSLQSQIDSGLSRTLNLESDLLSRIDSNSTSIADEIARAIEAEGDLQDLIDSESTRVTDINKALSDLIDSETRRAIDVETRLQSQIDSGLERSVTLESDLLGRIDSNATSIAEEIGRAILAEEGLQDAIDSATTRLTNINRTLSDLIDSEMTRAQGVEARLQSQIDSGLERSVNLESDLLSRIDSNSTSIADEITRAILAEGDLQSGIDSATSRLTNINKTLSDLIDSEMNRALDVEKDLQSQIDSGLSRSINLEADLTSMIDSNATDIRANNILIDQEIARAILRDSELSTAITQEAETRYDADSALQINIDAVNRRVDGLLDSAPGDLDTILEIIEAFRDADSDLKTLIENNSSILSTLNTDVGTLQGEMDDAEDILDDLQPRMDSAENRLDSLEGRTSVGESDVADLQSRLGSGPLDTVNQVIIPSINELHGEHDLVEGRMTAAESDIAANALYNLTAFDSVISRIEITEDRLDSNSAVLVDVLGDIVSLQLADSALGTRILGNDDDIASLDLRVDGNDSDIDAIRTTIQDIKGGKQVLRETNPLTVSDDTITLHLADDTSVSVTVNDNFLTGISLNPTTGVLTGFRRDGQTVATGFDSRYVHNQSSQALRSVNPITVDNDTITLHLADGNTAQVTVDDSDVNNFVNNLTFNSSDGVLTASRSGLPDLNVTLDGRYQPTGNYVTTNSAQALDPTNPITVLNDTITLNLADGNSVQVTVNDNYLTGVGFNTTTGLLTAYRNDAGLVTISLDGRYVEQTSAQALHPTNALEVNDDTITLYKADGTFESHSIIDAIGTDYFITGLSFNTSSGTLIGSRNDGNTVSTNFDGRYVNQNSVQALRANTPLTISGDTITLHRADGTSISVDIDDEFYPDDQTLSWNASSGELTISDGNTVDIDGRYTQTTSAQVLRSTNAIAVNNDTITIYKGDGTSESVTISDANTNTYITSLALSTDGELTIGRNDGGSFTVDLESHFVDKAGPQALHPTDALRSSGDTIYLYKGDGTREAVTIVDNNDFITGASFTGGTLSLTGSGSAGASVSLDGRYQPVGNYVTTTSAQALHPTNALEVNDDTITINKADGTSESHDISDALGTDYFITGLSFNTSNGVLTGTRNDGNSVTAGLDGRYDNYSNWKLTDGSSTESISSGETITVSGGDNVTTTLSTSTNTLEISAENDFVTGASFSNGTLSLTGTGDAGASVSLDGRYVEQTSPQALRATNPLTVNNDTITLHLADGTTDEVTISDANTNFYINAATFNGGTLSLTGVGAAGASVNLDGRYVPNDGVQALHSTDALRISGDTIYLYKGNGTYESVTFDDEHYHYQNLSFSGGHSGTGVLSISNGNSVDLDGRYVHQTSSQALPVGAALAVNNDTITLTRADGTVESVTISDANTNTYTTSFVFNDVNGVLSIGRNDGGNFSVDLDDRYVHSQSPQLLRTTNPLTVSGDTITLHMADGSTDAVTIDDDFFPNQNLSWNGANGQISISGGNTIDIDGRYQPAGDYVTTSHVQALHPTDALQVNNDTITLKRADGTTESVTISDAIGTDYFVTGISFNTGNGVLTANRNDGQTLTTDFDGRYVEQTSPQALRASNALTVSDDTITIHKGDGTSESVTISDYFEYDDQTLSWNGTTGKLTISDGNTVDLDGRYLLQGTYDNYVSWSLSDGSTSQEVTSLDLIKVVGGTNVTTSLNTTDNQLTISATDTNNYLSSVSWNASTDEITFGRNGLSSLSVDLGLAERFDKYDRWKISDGTNHEYIYSNDTLKVVGSGDVSTTYTASTNTLSIGSTNTYVDGASFNSSNDVLTLSRHSMSDVTVDLGLTERFDKYTSWTITDGTHDEAVTSGQSVKFEGAGAASTTYYAASNTLRITSTDTNDFITGASFSTGTGILSLTGTGGAGASVDLDGRYLLQGTYDNYVSWNLKNGSTTEAVTSGETIEFAGSGASSVSYNATSKKVTISSTDTNNYVNSASFSGGVLALGGVGAAGASVSLDGRYQLAGSYDNYNHWKVKVGSNNTDNIYSGNTLKFLSGGATSLGYNAETNTVTISSTDTNTDTNYYVDGASFNDTNGILTLSRAGLGDVTVDLDGRYATSNTDTTYDLYASTSANIDGAAITLDPSTGTSDQVWLKGGNNVSVSRVSSNQINIASTDTNNYVSSASYSAGSGKLTLHRAGLSSIDVTIGSNSNNYLDGASFNTGNGELTLSRSGGMSNVVVDLDGRYSTTDTNTTYSQATSSTLGLVKIGYNENGQNYPVELSNGQMYVNVPWTDTNTDTNTNRLTTFTVEDGDGTAVTMSHGKRFKFVEAAASVSGSSNYINMNWVDTSPGSTGDPYDLAISHNKTDRTNTTNSTSPGYSGSFTVVDNITTNPEGHITAVNTKTVSLPAAASGGSTDYINAASFNTGSGVLSLTGTGSAGASVDLDGRYYIRGDHIDLNDDKKVQFGTGDDYEISFDGSHLYIHQNQVSTNDIYISDVANANKFFFNVSTGDFHADGDIIAYSNSVSDEKLKENITVVENAVDKVQQLRGVEFTWKKDGEKSAGVIAQDVEKVLPQAVKEKDIMGEGEVVKTVNYDTMSALFIEAIKEQQEQIEALKAEIKALKG